MGFNAIDDSHKRRPGWSPSETSEIAGRHSPEPRSAATFGLPDTGAGTISAAPGTAAGGCGKTAGADCALALRVDIDDHGAVLPNSPGDVDLGFSGVDHVT